MAVVTTPIGSTPTILSPPPQAPAQTSAGYFNSRVVPIQQDSKPESADLKESEDAESLFSATLVSPAVAAALPHDYILRPLRRNDFALGFLDVLRVLTTVGEVSQTDFEHRFDEMKAGGSGGYHILVIVDGAKKIVGTGALMVEKKFIHQLGHVGHIEDIAVAKDQQGKKLGLRLIQALDYVAEHIGCYKTILDCSEANEGFYVKCGFKRAGLEMAHYYGRD